MSVQVGQKSVAFKPDRKGFAESGGVTFQAKNVSQYGVVYGGLMEFELTLSGAEWLAEFSRAAKVERGAPPVGSEVEIPLSLEIGKAKHTATARVSVKAR